ncbi:NF038104 family lipoprotein [Psychrobacter lutiphocae]|uniref:NF038104 family lipoprotein n=1 Tax=Psychrobacter lutiphocae TaxID=540500 RepID=UPI0003A74A38|nr:NF038104 family lipoprotein [Psychrobacter lutiphocae]
MNKLTLITLIVSSIFLQSCIHKVVTVPVKVAYKTTKGVVKGTVAVTKAVIPGGD